MNNEEKIEKIVEFISRKYLNGNPKKINKSFINSQEKVLNGI